MDGVATEELPPEGVLAGEGAGVFARVVFAEGVVTEGVVTEGEFAGGAFAELVLADELPTEGFLAGEGVLADAILVGGISAGAILAGEILVEGVSAASGWISWIIWAMRLRKWLRFALPPCAKYCHRATRCCLVRLWVKTE